MDEFYDNTKPWLEQFCPRHSGAMTKCEEGGEHFEFDTNKLERKLDRRRDITYLFWSSG